MHRGVPIVVIARVARFVRAVSAVLPRKEAGIEQEVQGIAVLVLFGVCLPNSLQLPFIIVA